MQVTGTTQYGFCILYSSKTVHMFYLKPQFKWQASGSPFKAGPLKSFDLIQSNQKIIFVEGKTGVSHGQQKLTGVTYLMNSYRYV